MDAMNTNTSTEGRTMANQISETEYSETITREQIIDLRREATAAGDDRMGDDCGQALAGDPDAIRRCERAIANARAQEAV